MADINSASQPAKVPYQPPRRSFAGPLVLIIIGVLLLLGTMHALDPRMLLHYFGRYWPALIIVWGLLKIIEYLQDQSAGRPSRGVGAGGYVFLVFLVLIGLSATGVDRFVDRFRSEITMDSDLAPLFGKTFEYTQELQQDFPAKSGLRVTGDRADVTVSSWDQQRIRVVVHKKVFADNEQEAQNLDASTRPTLTADPNNLTLDANPAGSGKPVQYQLEIYVPKKAGLDITTRHGDITARGTTGDVAVNAVRGDVNLQDITGNAIVNIGRNSAMGRGDVQMNNITGDVTVSGYISDTKVTDVGGAVRLDGEYFGDVEVARVGKAVRFRSSRTDLEFAKLDGDLTIDSSDLHGTSVTGPVRLVTRYSKDVRLDNVTGPVTVDNHGGSVEVHSAKLGAMEISNRNGDVVLSFPADAAFQLDATAGRGDINSEYPGLKIDTGTAREARASGVIGTGGPRVQVTNQHGNIEIRKAG